MKRLTVTVTQQDIKHAVRGNCSKCPIALAVSRQLLPGMSVEVGALAVRVCAAFVGPYREWESTLFEYMPPAAQTFIHRFDSGQKVKPFTFKL